MSQLVNNLQRLGLLGSKGVALDLGFGTGLEAIALVGLGYEVTAVEKSGVPFSSFSVTSSLGFLASLPTLGHA